MEEEFYRCSFCGKRISGIVWEISEFTHCCSVCEETVGLVIDKMSDTMIKDPDLYLENAEKLIKDMANEIH